MKNCHWTNPLTKEETIQLGTSCDIIDCHPNSNDEEHGTVLFCQTPNMAKYELLMLTQSWSSRRGLCKTRRESEEARKVTTTTVLQQCADDSDGLVMNKRMSTCPITIDPGEITNIIALQLHQNVNDGCSLGKNGLISLTPTNVREATTNDGHGFNENVIIDSTPTDVGEVDATFPFNHVWTSEMK